MLSIQHLTKRYGEKVAADDVTIEIQDGEVFGFIGHNGAGKTTTLKCAVGIQRYDEGEVLINGMSIKKEPVKCKQQMAYIPDNPDLYELLTGIQYLNFIADLYHINAEDRKKRIEKFAKIFEMESSLGNLIQSYSHGMKQKLALISAFIREPKVLILDEPFVGLDPKAAHDVKLLMRELCDTGSCVFFSTHVLEVAEKLCDKVAIIKNGKIIKIGTMAEVKGDQSLEDVFLELENDA